MTRVSHLVMSLLWVTGMVTAQYSYREDRASSLLQLCLLTQGF